MDVEELKPEEKELTEEEKKRVDDFLESMAKQHFATRIKDIKKYLKTHNITIEEAVKEVEEKRSYLTASSRGLLGFVKPEILNKWFNE